MQLVHCAQKPNIYLINTKMAIPQVQSDHMVLYRAI